MACIGVNFYVVANNFKRLTCNAQHYLSMIFIRFNA